MSEHETGVQPTLEQTYLERARKWLIYWDVARKLHPSQDNCVADLAAEFARVREEMKEQCAKEKK